MTHVTPKQSSIKAFDEAGEMSELKIPQEMIVQTIYRPTLGESLVPSFAKFGKRVEEQAKTNDPAVIIVCAPIGPTSTKDYKYYVSTQNTLDFLGLGDRPTVQKACNSKRTAFMEQKSVKIAREKTLRSLVA